jgi:NAD dependent epimerase/dehydratase family enzyme
MGEMAGPLLLEGANVLPKRLEQRGFAFQHPTIDGALRSLLG